MSAFWYLLLLNQIKLSASNNYRLHAFWGKLSVAVVIAILLSGAIMTLEFYERLAGFGVFSPDDAQARVRAGSFIGGAFLQWAIFIILYSLALFIALAISMHTIFRWQAWGDWVTNMLSGI